MPPNAGNLLYPENRSEIPWVGLVQSLFRSLLLVASYSIWIFSVRLFTLTLVTYFVTSPTTHFQDIIDVFSSNEMSLFGISVFLFLFLVCKLNPLTSTSFSDIFSRKIIEKHFLTSFIQGALLAGGIILIFVLTGTYRYLGYYIRFQETPASLANILFRVFTLIALAYGEGFIFFHKLTLSLKKRIPEFAQVHLVAFLFCGVKFLQFEFDTSTLISLYLLSISLFYRSQHKGEFGRGAGFWAAFLIIFQPVLSLPLFGNEFSGILLVKYPAEILTEGLTTGIDGTLEPLNSPIRLLTGGIGGPLCSLTFQLLLILDIGRSILKRRWRKPILSIRPHGR